MPESVLLAEERAEEELHELRRKFHPHHDYLNLIVPSTWFIIGIFALEFYFYHAAHLKEVLGRLEEVQPFFASAGNSLQFFLALSLFIAGFTAIYVIGQMINGFSALVLDRTLVKKLLKYPFPLYLRRLKTPYDEIDNRGLFRAIVLESSYLVFCLNLIPVVFLELVAWLFSRRVPTFTPWLQVHGLVVAAALILLVYIHFGKPSRRKPQLYGQQTPKALAHYAEFFLYHCILLVILFIFEFLMIYLVGAVATILLLPVINAVIGLAERRAKRTGTYSTPYIGHFYDYSRICFTNAIYWAAKLTGYGDIPSTEIIRTVHSAVGPDCAENDFFWLSYLTIQNRGVGSSQTMYHFLAMYGMVRNLCNATACILMVSVAIFWLEWPSKYGQGVAVWSVSLCVLMYALFIRYLYVYGSYFSRYVLRAAAFVFRSTRPHVQTQ